MTSIQRSDDSFSESHPFLPSHFQAENEVSVVAMLIDNSGWMICELALQANSPGSASHLPAEVLGLRLTQLPPSFLAVS